MLGLKRNLFNYVSRKSLRHQCCVNSSSLIKFTLVFSAIVQVLLTRQKEIFFKQGFGRFESYGKYPLELVGFERILILILLSPLFFKMVEKVKQSSLTSMVNWINGWMEFKVLFYSLSKWNSQFSKNHFRLFIKCYLIKVPKPLSTTL